MAKFKFESVKFENIMADYARIREQTIPDAVVANARLLCVELARRTQPFGADDVSKKTGEGRIKNDIGKIIKYPVDVLAMISKIENERIRKRLRTLYQNQRWDVIARIFSNVGYLKKWGGFENIEGMEQIQAVHQKNRNQRTGRTFNRADKLYITSSNDLDKHIKAVQLRVGMSKAGWAECARQLRRVTKGSPTRGMASYVVKQQGRGSVTDHSYDLTNPRVILTNETPWADNICPPAEQERAKSIVVQRMINQMRNILKKRLTTLPE